LNWLVTSQNHKHLVTAAASINAAPKSVYSIIADYRTGHPRIVPDTFSDMTVERGGVGDGTIIRFKMRVFGRTQSFRAAVTEPEPGRILVETDLDSNGAITTFTVNPGTASETSEVTITTELPVRSGPLGALERFLITRFLRPLYVKELALLAACAGERAPRDGPK
jgi:Polyketide cyclase / dehydrase and lipid transport